MNNNARHSFSEVQKAAEKLSNLNHPVLPILDWPPCKIYGMESCIIEGEPYRQVGSVVHQVVDTASSMEAGEVGGWVIEALEASPKNDSEAMEASP